MSKPNDKVRRIARTWNAFGERDPLWAVLTDPSKRGRKWIPAEFFASGEIEIAGVDSLLTDLHLAPGRGLAVDFGCGVGRLTRALASRFDRVIGIDVAESMIVEAHRLNADIANVTFLVNVRDDLRLVEARSVNFFYSRLVFQHMDPELTLGYVAELGRVLTRGGVAVFQIPRAAAARSGASRLGRTLLRPLRRLPGLVPRMSMFAVPPQAVEDALATAGLILVTTRDDQGALPLPSFLYIAMRPD